MAGHVVRQIAGWVSRTDDKSIRVGQPASSKFRTFVSDKQSAC